MIKTLRYGSLLLCLTGLALAACEQGADRNAAGSRVASLELGVPLPHVSGRPVHVQVRALDAAGQPVPHVAIVFTASFGSGSFDPRQPITDASGVASTTWTPGSRREFTLQARVVGGTARKSFARRRTSLVPR